MCSYVFLALEINALPAGDAVRSMADLVTQYGPFAFAVLFIFYVSRWSQAKYREAIDAKVATAELKTHRAVFVGSCLAALALVVVSVWHWIYYRPAIYVFKGEIVNLKDYERLSSQDLYRLVQRRPRVDENAPEQRNEQFVVFRDAPFAPTDAFQIDFSKGDGRVDELTLPWTADEHPRYLIQFDDTSRGNVLKRVGPAPSRPNVWHALLLPPAYAAELTQKVQSAIQQPRVESKRTLPTSAEAIASLQNPRSTVGGKITALESLLRGSTTASVLTTPTTIEAPAVTLIDLTRHSDKELAYLARTALESAHVKDVVRALLNSDQPSERAAGEAILFRMDQAEARQIAGSLRPDSRNQRLIAEVNSGARSINLRPTGSSQGDRYYVQASWPPADTRAAACLSGLFNDELINSRTLDAEKAMMAGRGKRLVYWYDKNWAIGIAQKISGCGGKAEFVSPRLAS